MISPNTEKEVKRQEIAPGIFIEKFQEKIKDVSYYVIKVELKIFQVLDFTVDFTGSQNVDLEHSNTLIKETILEPFTKVEVARLILSKKWNLKTKFKFALTLPSLEKQKEAIKSHNIYIHKILEKSIEFNQLDLTSMKQEEITSLLIKHKIEYIDSHFPPTEKSLITGKEKVEERYESLVHWRKGKDAEAVQNPDAGLAPIFENEPLSENVRHGKLNDGGVISAIAALAEYPKLVQRLFLTKSANEAGVYKIKLGEVGRWRIFVVDDFFPCFPLGGLMFSKSDKRELWVPLLEKAFAKKYDGYQNLININSADILVDLTGCPVFTIDLETVLSKDTQNQLHLWKQMSDWKSRKYILTSDTRQFLNVHDDNKHVKNFTYSIIRLIEIPHSKYHVEGISKSEISRLINIRNLWGLFEWSGDWSHDSAFWTDEIKSDFDIELDPEQRNIWIPLENFVENFQNLHVGRVQKWNELRLRGKFVNGIDQNNPKISHFCSRWYYHIEIPETTNVIFGLHQEDEKDPYVGKTRPFIDIGLSVIKVEKGVWTLLDYHDTDFVRQDFLEIKLERGEYIILPRSNGVCLDFDQELDEVTLFSIDNPLVVSVIEDIFEKYDLILNGFLSFDEISAFYSFIQKPFTTADYQNIIKKYKTHAYSVDFHHGISKNWFVKLFFSLIEKMKNAEIYVLFEKLGYKKNLFSNRTRLFNISLHSDIFLNVTVKDALTENIDFGFLRLLLQKFGTNINDVNDKTHPPEVQGFFYFNKFVNKKNS